MVGIACWQVVSRYIWRSQHPTEEMLRFSGVGINAGHGFIAGQKQSISA